MYGVDNNQDHQSNTERVNEGRSHRMLQIFISFFAIIFILVLVYINYVPNKSNAEYSPNSYYYGLHVSDSKEDPLDTYSMLTGNSSRVSKDGSCKTEWETVESSNLLVFSGLNLGVELSDASFDPSNVKEYGEKYVGTNFSFDDDDMNHWYLWGSGNVDQHIVSPFKSMELRNSNFSNPNIIDVAAAGNSSFIRFYNVTNWFCHYDSESLVKSHTVKIGVTSDDDLLRGYSSLNDTYPIIGRANVRTYMVGIKVDSSGQEQECSPAEVFEVN